MSDQTKIVLGLIAICIFICLFCACWLTSFLEMGDEGAILLSTIMP